MGDARCDTRMHRERPKTLRVASRQQCSHPGTCREPSHSDACGIDRLRQANLVDCRSDGAGLTLGLARTRLVPVPAALQIRETVLLWIEHKKAFPRGNLVHT